MVHVGNPLDIIDLPWVGNHFCDCDLFTAIDDYMKHRCADVDDARTALDLMALRGMGIDEPVTVEDVREYFDMIEADPPFAILDKPASPVV